MQLRRLTALTTAIIVLAGAAIGAQAQKAGDSWAPDGNVEFVVGAGAGGENDRIARAIQHALIKEHLVHSMTVLNRPRRRPDHRHQLSGAEERRRQRDRARFRQLHQRHCPQRIELAQERAPR